LVCCSGRVADAYSFDLMTTYARPAHRVPVFYLTATESTEEHENMSIKAFIFPCFSGVSG
jgi:hypothetical protein